MITRRVFILCMLAVTLFGGKTALAEKLVKAEFDSHTNDENKDFDSGVWVEVKTHDNNVLLAEVTGGDATKEYKDETDNQLALVIKSDGSTVADCDKFVFRIGMKPNGNDTWRFKGKVTLYFDNGKTIQQDIGNSEIKSKNELKWTDWAEGK